MKQTASKPGNKNTSKDICVQNYKRNGSMTIGVGEFKIIEE
jgi:hypothetical protein